MFSRFTFSKTEQNAQKLLAAKYEKSQRLPLAKAIPLLEGAIAQVQKRRLEPVVKSADPAQADVDLRAAVRRLRADYEHASILERITSSSISSGRAARELINLERKYPDHPQRDQWVAKALRLLEASATENGKKANDLLKLHGRPKSAGSFGLVTLSAEQFKQAEARRKLWEAASKDALKAAHGLSETGGDPDQCLHLIRKGELWLVEEIADTHGYKQQDSVERLQAIKAAHEALKARQYARKIEVEQPLSPKISEWVKVQVYCWAVASRCLLQNLKNDPG
ncbi:MAG: hypothetical protein KGH63_04705, partial [Candidatus Micrarchaeota archaeon]|nr:hypothetical protein [Candidatus Micrarchaeota archaeon]